MFSKHNERSKDQQDDFIIPPYLFEEPNPRLVVEYHFVNFMKKEYLHLRKSLTISLMTVMI